MSCHTPMQQTDPAEQFWNESRYIPPNAASLWGRWGYHTGFGSDTVRICSTQTFIYHSWDDVFHHYWYAGYATQTQDTLTLHFQQWVSDSCNCQNVSQFLLHEDTTHQDWVAFMNAKYDTVFLKQVDSLVFMVPAGFKQLFLERVFEQEPSYYLIPRDHYWLSRWFLMKEE